MPNPAGNFVGQDPDYDLGKINVQWSDLGTGAAGKVYVVWESRQYVWNLETLSWERATAGGSGSTGEITAFDYDGAGNLVYEGRAAPGTAKGSTGWQIRRFVYTGTSLTDTQYANGSTSFSNIWNNRAALPYS